MGAPPCRISGFFEPVERIFSNQPGSIKGHRLSRTLTLVHQEHQDGIVLRKTLHLGAARRCVSSAWINIDQFEGKYRKVVDDYCRFILITIIIYIYNINYFTAIHWWSGQLYSGIFKRKPHSQTAKLKLFAIQPLWRLQLSCCPAWIPGCHLP